MNAKRLTHKDFDCPEDDFNNLMIDLWELSKKFKEGTKLHVVIGMDEIITFAFIKGGTEIISFN